MQKGDRNNLKILDRKIAWKEIYPQHKKNGKATEKKNKKLKQR